MRNALLLSMFLSSGYLWGEDQMTMRSLHRDDVSTNLFWNDSIRHQWAVTPSSVTHGFYWDHAHWSIDHYHSWRQNRGERSLFPMSIVTFQRGRSIAAVFYTAYYDDSHRNIAPGYQIRIDDVHLMNSAESLTAVGLTFEWITRNNTGFPITVSADLVRRVRTQGGNALGELFVRLTRAQVDVFAVGPERDLWVANRGCSFFFLRASNGQWGGVPFALPPRYAVPWN